MTQALWAKRFPVPEFDRHILKNLEWSPPEFGSLENLESGCVAVDGGQAFYEHFGFTGSHLLAVACKLPGHEVKISGNSFAWPIHHVVITDSLDVSSCTVLADWTTPRPMNTRLGPNGGISISGTEAYLLIGHRFSDHWVANRIMMDNQWTGSSENGFRILSSSEEEINDFHDAVLYFEW